MLVLLILIVCRLLFLRLIFVLVARFIFIRVLAGLSFVVRVRRARSTVEHRRAVFVVVGDHGSCEFLTFVRIDRALGKPRPFCDPDMIELSGLGDGEDSLRNPGAKTFIDDPEVERHWNGRRFIGTCVVELPVQHDCDGNDAGFFPRQLDQSQRAWTLVGRSLAPVLRCWFLAEEPATAKTD